MGFSESVKSVLKSMNLTPSDLARMTGYTPQYIHELLAGKKRWNETTIEKTCEALGLELRVSSTKRPNQLANERQGI